MGTVAWKTFALQSCSLESFRCLTWKAMEASLEGIVLNTFHRSFQININQYTHLCSSPVNVELWRQIMQRRIDQRPLHSVTTIVYGGAGTGLQAAVLDEVWRSKHQLPMSTPMPVAIQTMPPNLGVRYCRMVPVEVGVHIFHYWDFSMFEFFFTFSIVI